MDRFPDRVPKGWSIERPRKPVGRDGAVKDLYAMASIMDKPAPTPKVEMPAAALWESAEMPRIAIIITHHNYSDHLEDCVASVLRQTYDKVDVIVVDDCSDPQHANRASEIVEGFPDGSVRLVKNAENKGQITSFYEGLNHTDADFVVLLDPDDRLHSEFCREMVSVHLNSDIYCGQASCNQIFVRNNVMLTGTSGHSRPIAKESFKVEPEFQLKFVGAHTKGWHWPSTSSLVLRRDAVEMLRPRKPLQTMRAADAYFGPLIHAIGGSLYYSKPLVLRNFHDDNSWLPDRVVSRLTTQKGRHKTGDLARIEALDAFFSNGAWECLERNALRSTLRANLNMAQRRQLAELHPSTVDLLEDKAPPRRGFLQRLGRSVRKRLKWGEAVTARA